MVSLLGTAAGLLLGDRGAAARRGHRAGAVRGVGHAAGAGRAGGSPRRDGASLRKSLALRSSVPSCLPAPATLCGGNRLVTLHRRSCVVPGGLLPAAAPGSGRGLVWSLLAPAPWGSGGCVAPFCVPVGYGLQVRPGAFLPCTACFLLAQVTFPAAAPTGRLVRWVRLAPLCPQKDTAEGLLLPEGLHGAAVAGASHGARTSQHPRARRSTLAPQLPLLSPLSKLQRAQEQLPALPKASSFLLISRPGGGNEA